MKTVVGVPTYYSEKDKSMIRLYLSTHNLMYLQFIYIQFI